MAAVLLVSAARAAVAFPTAAAVAFSTIFDRFVLAYSCDPCDSRLLVISTLLLAAVVGRHATFYSYLKRMSPLFPPGASYK